MGQPEGMHLVSETDAGHISSQVRESMMSKQKKVVPEQELSGKIRCFACSATSHSLDQCSTKYKLVTVAHKFGYATKFPFIMIITPSEDMLEKEKFYHHCLLITSNVSNLNLGILKGELQKLWNLSGDWILRRKCSKSFLASFSSQDDVVSCLKNPNMETLLDDEEVNLTVTRWTEGDDQSNGLIKQWFLVCGVPRKYRAWTELYQVASAFGVLIDVDEGSLQVGDKEPIRLKIALKNHDGAPFSYHYVVGWCSRMVMLTVEAKIDSENNDHNTRIVTSTGNHVLDFGDSSDKEHGKELNAAQILLLEEPTCIIEESRLDGKTKENKTSTAAANVNKSKETTIESSKPEGVQSICRNSTTIIGEDRVKGIQKPPIKHVYKRRGKKQQVTDEAINKSPSNKLDKGMGQESSNSVRIEASEMEGKRELNMEEIALVGMNKKSEEVGECREKEEISVTLVATTINSEKKISEGSSETERTQFKNSTIIGEDHFRGIPKPPIKYVFKRRGKKLQGTEAINKSPSECV
ncbi:hypothetical protein SEVIR_1G035100v4 [Setaria viridis]|nr:uncharacterized protein LOC117834089 [Setaria viridis]